MIQQLPHQVSISLFDRSEADVVGWWTIDSEKLEAISRWLGTYQYNEEFAWRQADGQHIIYHFLDPDVAMLFKLTFSG